MKKATDAVKNQFKKAPTTSRTCRTYNYSGTGLSLAAGAFAIGASIYAQLHRHELMSSPIVTQMKPLISYETAVTSTLVGGISTILAASFHALHNFYNSHIAAELTTGREQVYQLSNKLNNQATAIIGLTTILMGLSALQYRSTLEPIAKNSLDAALKNLPTNFKASDLDYAMAASSLLFAGTFLVLMAIARCCWSCCMGSSSTEAQAAQLKKKK